MARIERRAVATDGIRESSDFLKSLAAIMARLTQRLQLAKPEHIPIAFVRHDVIRDGRHRNLATRGAASAHRLDLQLVCGTFAPTREIVPRFETATAHGFHRGSAGPGRFMQMSPGDSHKKSPALIAAIVPTLVVNFKSTPSRSSSRANGTEA